ncbi:MAG: hypothetical protein AAF478_13980, partial [Pseudomonadota bacterium]
MNMLHQSETHQQNDIQSDFLLASIFTSVVVSTAALIWICRHMVTTGVVGPAETVAIVRVTGLSLALIWIKPLISEMNWPHATSLRFCSLVVMFSIPWIVTRFVNGGIALFIPDALYLAIVVAGFFVCLRQHLTGGLWLNICFGFMLSVSIFLATLGKQYLTPFVIENVLNGTQHRDTIYHAAIANVIEIHGVISLGLDGFVPQYYHVLSHRLIGAISTWLNLNVLQSSYLLVAVVTLPLLFHLTCEAITVLRPHGWPPLSGLQGLVFFLCWPLAFSLLQTSAYFSSESYILSLVVLMATVPLMVHYSQSTIGLISRLSLLALFSIAIFLSASAKISTGAVLSAGLFAFIVLVGRFRIASIVLAMIFCALPLVAVFLQSYGAKTANTDLISPLHFLFEWREVAIFHIILVALTGASVLKHVRQSPESPILVIALFLMALASLTSSLLLKLPAGAAIYFANPGMWICVILIGMTMPAPSWAKDLSPPRQILIAFAVFVAISVGEKERWRAVSEIELRLSVDSALAADQPAVNLTIAEQVQNQIDEIGREFLVFIGPEFEEFWKQTDICWAQSFVIPALTGQTMIRGLPPESSDCVITQNYGLNAYDQQISRSADLKDDELCETAISRSYFEILRFDDRNGRR